LRLSVHLRASFPKGCRKISFHRTSRDHSLRKTTIQIILCITGGGTSEGNFCILC